MVKYLFGFYIYIYVEFLFYSGGSLAFDDV